MAGKPREMNIIKQIYRLHIAGKAKKTIARELNVSKNTVKSYLSKLESHPESVTALLKADDPVLAGKLYAGNPSYKEGRYGFLKGNFPYYAKELARVGVTKDLLWQEYKQKHPDGYGRSQFTHHLSKYLKTQTPSMVLTHLPADKLYIDFAGKRLSYIDPVTGEVIYCQVFVACLPYSDYCFAMAVHSQTLTDFIGALTKCLEHIGGVPATLVPDNLKAAVIKANNYEPDINKVLNDFANHYQTTVTPARARKPKDKALVENQVKIIYNRVYARLRDQQFFSLYDLNQAISNRVLIHNQTRMQRKDYCREERFLSSEKGQLKVLCSDIFQIKYYKNLKVAQNNHIYLSVDKHYYSVPYPHIGAQAKVIFTNSLVKIYVCGQLVAIHHRRTTIGYSTTKDHLCSQHKHYLDRSPSYYLSLAKKRSSQLHSFIELLFAQQGRYPEQLYRSCDGLLSLSRKINVDDFDKALRKAIDNQKYTYQFVKNILENKTHLDDDLQQNLGLPDHPNTRGNTYYN
jgi:transposase